MIGHYDAVVFLQLVAFHSKTLIGTMAVRFYGTSSYYYEFDLIEQCKVHQLLNSAILMIL
jgi:hypothetical protein